MNEDLYNYDALYGNGLAAQSYSPTQPYRPTLRPNTQAVTPTPAVATPAGTGVLNTSGTPSWMANAQALGTLGLGLASFLDQRKTAGLQRDALRHNLQLSREHQASRKALGNSWNQAWGQS